jgi:hypothetical protein
MSSGDQFNDIKEVSGLDFGPKTYLVSKQLHTLYEDGRQHQAGHYIKHVRHFYCR